VVLVAAAVALAACSGDGSPRARAPAAGDPTASEAPRDDLASPTTTPGGLEEGGADASCPDIGGEPLLDRELDAETVLLQEGDETAPTVEAVVYPHPDYEGNPWSQWGQGLVLPGGKFVAALGDHLGPDGNAYVYEYDLGSKQLTLLTDVRSRTDHEPGAWGYGKIHGQMVPGPCGEFYFSTFWGDTDGLTYGPAYPGDQLFRVEPDTRTIANLGTLAPERGLPSLAGSPRDGLVYAEAADPRFHAPDRGAFVAYDTKRRKVVYRNDDLNHIGFRNIAVDAQGRAYYSVGESALDVYDPETNEVSRHPSALPGDWLRASTLPAPDGTVYGVTNNPDVLFALEPSGEIRTIGPTGGYTTSITLGPEANEVLFVPNAHGGAATGSLVSMNTETGKSSPVAELGPLVQQKLGLRVSGSYNVAFDPSNKVVYVGLNAGEPESEIAFGEIVLVTVHLP
jgi:hypothetical protein